MPKDLVSTARQKQMGFSTLRRHRRLFYKKQIAVNCMFGVLGGGHVCRYIKSQILLFLLIFVESVKMVKKILLVAGLVAISLCFSGCQTVQGIGEDITWSGEAGTEVIYNILYPPHKNQEPEIAYQGY